MNPELPNYFQTPQEVKTNPSLDRLDGDIYAVIYWFARLKNKKCYLTNPQIAEMLKISPKSVTNSLTRLEKCNCIKRVFSDKSRRVRDEIIPLISMDKKKEVPSTDGRGTIHRCNRYHPQMVEVPSTDGHNKRIKEENIKKESNSSPEGEERETPKKKKSKKPEEVLNIGELFPRDPEPVKNEPTGFDQFWSAYPRKEEKKKAKIIWDREGYDKVLPEILAFLSVANKSERWSKENIKYIKLPTTFLNGECWQDDISAYPPAKVNSENNVRLPIGNQEYSGFIKK